MDNAARIREWYWQLKELGQQTASDEAVPYVERAAGHDGRLTPAHVELAEALRRPKGTVQCLLTGQVGCGKSTELHRLLRDEDVDRLHEIIEINAERELNLARPMHIRELLVVVAAALATRVAELAPRKKGWLGVAPNRATAIREWVRILAKDGKDDLPDPNTVSPLAFLSAVTGKLMGVPALLKSDDDLRDTLHTHPVSKVRELVVALRDELASVSERTVPVLLLVDDLDKVRDPDTMRHIFRDHLSTLRGLPLRWVLTLPYSLRFDPSAQIPTDLEVPLPNIKVVARNAPGVLLPNACSFFQQLLGGLVDLDLFDPTVIDGAALLSAGIPREFLRVIRMSLGVAKDLRASRVEADHLRQAESLLRREMQPLHADPVTTLELELVRVQQDKLRPEQPALMATLLVVEYTNDRQWYDVHPALVAEYEALVAARARRLGKERGDIEALAANILEDIARSARAA